MKLEEYIEVSEKYLQPLYKFVWKIDPYPGMNGKRATSKQRAMDKNLQKVKDALDIIKCHLEDVMCFDPDIEPKDFDMLVDQNGLPFPSAITHIFFGFAEERRPHVKKIESSNSNDSKKRDC